MPPSSRRKRLRRDPPAPPLLGDLSLLFARILVGAFLVWGVWDNIVDRARMREFAEFLAAHGFLAPTLMAPLSVAVQFASGLALILGLATRWAGWLVVANFLVALMMVDAALGIRGAFPSLALVALGLVFASHGGGRFSLDQALERRRPTA